MKIDSCLEEIYSDFPSTAGTWISLTSSEYITNYMGWAGSNQSVDLYLPEGIAYGNDAIYVANNGAKSLYPEVLLNVYSLSSANGNIMKLTTSGTLSMVFDIQALDDSRDVGPIGIAYGEDFGGNTLGHDVIIYADAWNSAICMVDVDTGLPSIFDGRYGAMNWNSVDMYGMPFGVTIDSTNRKIYITEWYDSDDPHRYVELSY